MTHCKSAYRVPLPLTVALVAVTLTAAACSNEPAKPSIPKPEPSSFSILIDNEIDVPMRDGTNLKANVYRPDAAGTYPVIMALTPYNKSDLPANYEPDDDSDKVGVINVSDIAAFEQVDPKTWVPRGYAVVSIDARGMMNSGGDMALLTDLEAEDYYDAIEWFGERPWSNGNVGLNGVSYMAINQWKVAALNPPHLKAIMPWEGFTDVYRDVAYHGGIPGSFIPGWYEHVVLGNKNPDAADQELAQQVAQQPLDGPYYQSLSPQDLSEVTVPAYVVASWPDHGLHTRGTLEGFSAIASPSKWLEVHGRLKWEWYYSEAAVERQIAFFDHFLAGKDSAIVNQARVTYEAREAYYQGETKTAESWPLSDAKLVSLHLDAGTGVLLSEAPPAAATVSYQAAQAAQPGDPNHRAAFSYTFSERTEVTGGMALRLSLSVDGADDVDLFVGVQKYAADGTQVHLLGNGQVDGQVANGWLRASHRALDAARSRPNRPYHLHTSEQKLSAGEIVNVDVEILPSSTVFQPGESLVVVIQGSDLEESGLQHATPGVGVVTLHSGPGHPAELIFPVVE